jgi:hypothetical protein
MGEDQLGAIKALAMPAQPSPEPAPDLAQRVTDLEATVQTLLVALSRLNDVLVNRFDAVRAALDPANPPA